MSQAGCEGVAVLFGTGGGGPLAESGRGGVKAVAISEGAYIFAAAWFVGDRDSTEGGSLPAAVRAVSLCEGVRVTAGGGGDPSCGDGGPGYDDLEGIWF